MASMPPINVVRDTEERGMKYDGGKPRVGLVMSGFPNALLKVSEVSTFGAKKYAAGSWRTVPNAYERYMDAKYRHMLAREAGEVVDAESQMLHLAHEAWNALATLELYLTGESITDGRVTTDIRPTREDVGCCGNR